MHHYVDATPAPRLYVAQAKPCGWGAALNVIAVGDITLFSDGRAFAPASDPYLSRKAISCAVVFAAVIGIGGIYLMRTATANEGVADVVTRAEISPISLPAPVPAVQPEAVSEKLVRPVRLIDRSARQHDLGQLVHSALLTLEYPSQPQDRLQQIVVQALAERQSDQYIHGAVNAALTRGEFAAPASLMDPYGRFQTDVLLQAVLNQAQN